MIKMIKRKGNFLYIAMFLAIFSFCIVTDTNSFLKMVGHQSLIPSFQDIIVCTISGFLKNGRASIIETIRFSIPYIFCLVLIHVYLDEMLDSGNMYCNLVRYNTFKKWLKVNIIKLIKRIVAFFSIYYVAIILSALILSRNYSGYTDILNYLNADMEVGNFLSVIFYQYILSILISIIMTLVSLFLTLKLDDDGKSFTFLAIFIIVGINLGKFDMVNLFMISKYSTFGLGIHPMITIFSEVIIVASMYLFLMKYIKPLIRRNKL